MAHRKYKHYHQCLRCQQLPHLKTLSPLFAAHEILLLDVNQLELYRQSKRNKCFHEHLAPMPHMHNSCQDHPIANLDLQGSYQK